MASGLCGFESRPRHPDIGSVKPDGAESRRHRPPQRRGVRRVTSFFEVVTKGTSLTHEIERLPHAPLRFPTSGQRSADAWTGPPTKEAGSWGTC